MAEVVSGEAVVLDVPAAGFPSRLVALLLDLLVQVTGGVVIIVVLSLELENLDPDLLGAIALVVLVGVIVAYPVLFETLTRGRSLGKLAMGLRVVSDDGSPERFRQALVRGLASIIEIWLLTGAPAVISSMISARGKRLGDWFAGTIVIQERLPRRRGLPPMFAAVPRPLLGWSQSLQLSGLSEQTAEQAASYLRRFTELMPATRAGLGQQIAAAVAAQVTPPPPPGTPVSAFLAAVLAVRRHREMARLSALQASAAAAHAAASGAPGGPGGSGFLAGAPGFAGLPGVMPSPAPAASPAQYPGVALTAPDPADYPGVPLTAAAGPAQYPAVPLTAPGPAQYPGVALTAPDPVQVPPASGPAVPAQDAGEGTASGDSAAGGSFAVPN